MESTLDDNPPRVRLWAQVFLEHDNQLMQAIGRNFTFLLDNVDAYESGDIDERDLPEFKREIKWTQWRSIGFGTRWPLATPEVHVVLDDADTFVGLYGHEENAVDRASDDAALHVQEVAPEPRDVESYIEPLWDGNDIMRRVGENFEALLDDHTLLSSPEDLPHCSQNIRVLMAHSVVFGTVWESSYPGLYAVLGLDQQFHGLYSDPNDAKEAAESDDRRVQRVSVADGDLPPEDIIEFPDEVASDLE